MTERTKTMLDAEIYAMKWAIYHAIDTPQLRPDLERVKEKLEEEREEIIRENLKEDLTRLREIMLTLPYTIKDALEARELMKKFVWDIRL